MPSYCFFDVRNIKHPEKMGQYRENVLATVARYEGRYVLIGGPYEILEGNWKPIYPVIIEFPTRESADDWYTSKEYQTLKALRMEAADTNAVVLHGF